jgi:hypothetical protein
LRVPRVRKRLNLGGLGRLPYSMREREIAQPRCPFGTRLLVERSVVKERYGAVQPPSFLITYI